MLHLSTETFGWDRLLIIWSCPSTTLSTARLFRSKVFIRPSLQEAVPLPLLGSTLFVASSIFLASLAVWAERRQSILREDDLILLLMDDRRLSFILLRRAEGCSLTVTVILLYTGTLVAGQDVALDRLMHASCTCWAFPGRACTRLLPHRLRTSRGDEDLSSLDCVGLIAQVLIIRSLCCIVLLCF